MSLLSVAPLWDKGSRLFDHFARAPPPTHPTPATPYNRRAPSSCHSAPSQQLAVCGECDSSCPGAVKWTIPLALVWHTPGPLSVFSSLMLKQSIQLSNFFFLFFFFFCGAEAWTEGLHLEPLHQPIFVMGFFEIGSHELFDQGWFQTTILLISASWVARITGMSH
jgi:hypothetical protein